MLNPEANFGYLRNKHAYGGKGVLYVNISPDRSVIKLHAPTEPRTKMMLQDTYKATILSVNGKDRIISEEVIRTQGDNLPYDRPSTEDVDSLLKSSCTGTTTWMSLEETHSIVDRIKKVFNDF
jgi:hypothetical protein